VLHVLRGNQLFAKFSKYHFAVTEVDYLGHIVTAQGVSVAHQKIKAVMDWPIPKKLKELRGFL